MIHPSTRTDPDDTFVPAERPDAAECAPSLPWWVAELSLRNPAPVTAADFHPHGDNAATRAQRENDEVPF